MSAHELPVTLRVPVASMECLQYVRPDVLVVAPDEAPGRGWPVISFDIMETATRLEREDVVLSFVDTDNYSSARAALGVVQERTVVGGAIVFDHFTGVERSVTPSGSASRGCRCWTTRVTFTCTARACSTVSGSEVAGRSQNRRRGSDAPASAHTTREDI